MVTSQQSLFSAFLSRRQTINLLQRCLLYFFEKELTSEVVSFINDRCFFEIHARLFQLVIKTMIK